MDDQTPRNPQPSNQPSERARQDNSQLPDILRPADPSATTRQYTTGPLPEDGRPSSDQPTATYQPTDNYQQQPQTYQPPQYGYSQPPPSPPPVRRSAGPLIGAFLGGGLLVAALLTGSYFIFLQPRATTQVGNVTPTSVALLAPTATSELAPPTATDESIPEATATAEDEAVPTAETTNTPRTNRATRTPRPGRATATPAPVANNDSRYPVARPYGPDTPAPTPQSPLSHPLAGSFADDQQLAMLPDNAGDLGQLNDPPLYTVEATLDFAGRKISGRETVTYTNNTGQSLNEVYFRLWPNAPDLGKGATTISDLRVNGESGVVQPEVEGTALKVALATPLAPEAQVAISFNFEQQVPTDEDGYYGIYSYDSNTEIMSLASWLPMIPPYDDTGWFLDPFDVTGDPTHNQIALFDVRLTAPTAVKLVTSGVAINEPIASSDTVTARYVTGPMRDFALVASEQFEVDSREVNGITVKSWYLPRHSDSGKKVAQYTADAIKHYSTLIGQFPYREMDAVEVPIGGGASGVEFPGLIMMGSELYDGTQEDMMGIETRALEFTTVHEVGHQWWYGMVGNNPQRAAFLDEGLTQYTSLLYMEQQYDKATADQMEGLYMVLTYQAQLGGLGGMLGDSGGVDSTSNGDDILYQPTGHWNGDGFGYGAIVYGKGPLFFHALRNDLGDDDFFKGLQAYFQQGKYNIVLPEDFARAFNEATGKNITTLYNRWVLEEHGAEDIDQFSSSNPLGNIMGGSGNPFGDPTPTP